MAIVMHKKFFYHTIEHTFGWEFREAEIGGETEDLAVSQNQWDEPTDQWQCVWDAIAWPSKCKSLWLLPQFNLPNVTYCLFRPHWIQNKYGREFLEM